MSTRTVIEINHDHLRDLRDEDIINALIRRLSSGDFNDERLGYIGSLRILGQRHHSETLRLKVD